jgi:hypothetical protein
MVHKAVDVFRSDCLSDLGFGRDFIPQPDLLVALFGIGWDTAA